ncbi:MAG: ABC transporter substrate-binding protein [Erysipelotrichaceae bacterium]
MKKLMALLVAGLMTLSLTACGSSNSGADKTLVVGTPEMNGDFVAGFTNSSYDKWVRDLLHGYETVSTDEEGSFLVNPTVVKEMVDEEDADGNKTFTFTLNSGLEWSDGTAITANDYVFSVLWAASKEWSEAGAVDSTGDSFVGYAGYHDGTAGKFEGVKLIDDSKFSLTIAAENLPYFYEWSYVAVTPVPMHVYAEGATISSDDTGSSIEGTDLVANTKDVASEFRFRPTVTSGPYTFESYENGQVVLKLNEKFAGDWTGDKPTIGTIVQKSINQTTDMDILVAGETHILAGVVEGEKIEKGKAASNLAFSQYSRNGYGNVPIATDFGATSDAAVRRAIAYVIDKDTVIQNVLGGYGSTVNGDYGKAQWMYQVNKAEVDALPNYAFSIDNANTELDTTEWVYEADGTTPWDATKAVSATDYYRYNAAGEVLEIRHLGTENNPVTDALEVSFLENYPKVGVKFSLDRTDFAGLLDNYYDGYKLGADRKYNTFNMATSFTPVYDPYYGSFHSDFAGTQNNPTQISDAYLDATIEAMRNMDPEQKDDYAAAWLAYQTRWNELLPTVPIYANTYFDFYSADLEFDVQTGPMKSWSELICKIKFK